MIRGVTGGSQRDHIQGLDLLMLGYFHPDWPVDDPSPDDVLRAFARAEPEAAPRAIDEITGLLDSENSERELHTLLLDPQSPDPRGGLSWRQWLAHVRDVLAAPV